MPYWRLHYHLVWATQQRESVLTEDVRAIVERSMRLTSDDLGLICHAIGFMPEHMHVAVSIPPRHAVSEVMKRLKGDSSHAVRAEHPAFTWQTEYGALSFGDRALPTVTAYVQEQAARHAARTTIARLERTESER
jgi:putative transposase